MAKKDNENVEAPGKLAGGITQAQLDGWKKQFGDVHQIDVIVSKDDTATCYIKPADSDRNIVAAAMSKFNKGQLLETGEFMLQNCWLGGDVRCKDEAKIAIAAAMQAAGTIEFLESSSKKL
jgi:hypothetical protein